MFIITAQAFSDISQSVLALVNICMTKRQHPYCFIPL
jgi:hypothetical protein